MRIRPPAFPHIHFMAAAPLDAWARLFLTPGARIPPRYWPRVGVNLVLSACVTAFTLPERVALAPVLWWWGRRSGWRLGRRGANESAPSIVVLGYYRSGTTHLHNLLACDPHNHTPRWGQVLAPQGFVLSWFVLKLFLWAALPTKRPQDDMAFGPEWPGEDDFALASWTLSSPLHGRVVLPRCYEHFARFNDLEGLTPREKSRWRRTQWAILAKIAWLVPRRRLLLKTPPHTAKAPAIMDVLGGPGRVKFIHLSRDPAAVLRSNQRLMHAMGAFHLQDAPADDAVRERLIGDYEHAERRYLEAESSIPEGDVVRMRYEDLVADPVGQLRLAYERLGLDWSDQFRRRLESYLESVREYRSETQKLAARDASAAAATQAKRADASAPDSQAESARLAWIATEFGHDAPAVANAEPPPPAPRAPKNTAPWRASLAMAAGGVGVVAIWSLVAAATGHRSASFALLAGVAIGLSAARVGPGSVARGLSAGMLALVMAVVGVAVAVWLVDLGGSAGVPPGELWSLLLPAWWRRFSHESTLLWTGLGALAAYRLASRRFGGVPGR
ncbi:MAG: sulfotransferase [Phycisphaeraceae bacterium]|nr:sulfotransferase [Phycisphaeraceae bacterium]